MITRRAAITGSLWQAASAKASDEPATFDLGARLRGPPYDGVLTLDGVLHRPFATPAPYALRAGATPASGPPRLFRFEVRPGDDGGHVGSVDKVELQTGPVAAPGGEVWRSWSLMIPEGPRPALAPRGENWLILGQWHATEDVAANRGFDDDSLSPPLCHDFAGGTYSIFTRTDPAPRQLRSRYPRAELQYRDTGFPRGHWVRLVERTRFDWSGAAVLQVWRDGRPIVDRTMHFSMGYNDLRTPHCCWGVYRNRFDAKPFIAWYADVRFGGSELAPA